jgi:hypothetical protein
MKIVLSIKSQYTCTGLLEHENGWSIVNSNMQWEIKHFNNDNKKVITIEMWRRPLEPSYVWVKGFPGLISTPAITNSEWMLVRIRVLIGIEWRKKWLPQKAMVLDEDVTLCKTMRL